MRSRLSGALIKNKYYPVGGYIIIAMLILSATIFLSTHTFSVPPNDFMLIAWMPGQQLLHQGAVDMQYPYPLWTPILMLPFVLWSPEIGAQLWFICNLLLLAASMIVIMKLLKWPVRFVTVAISSLCLGAYTPVFTSLWLGQFIFVSLFALVVLVHALRNGAWTAVGAILAFSLIKPQVTILVTAVIFGVAVWQRRWKVFVGFGVVLCVFVAIAAPFAATASQILGGGVGEHLTLYLGRTSTLWGLILTLIPDSLLFATVVSCLLCGWVVYLWVSALITGQWTERMIYLIMITTIVNLLIIPYSWSYNHTLLIFPFCYAIDQTRMLQKPARLIWLAVLFALFYPISNTIYMYLTSVYHSDVYQIIPVLCFLLLIVALQWHADCVSKQEGNLAKAQTPQIAAVESQLE